MCPAGLERSEPDGAWWERGGSPGVRPDHRLHGALLSWGRVDPGKLPWL